MENFEVVNPTRILFGKNQLTRLPELLEELNVKNILLVYGGGSIKKIGLFDELISKLTDFEVTEFGGVEANPDYATLMKGVEFSTSTIDS